MTPLTWGLLAAAIGSEVGATLSLRASAGFSRWGWTFPVAIGYLVSSVLLALVLKRGMPVGVAYGVWAGGVVLIGAGVLLLEYGSEIAQAAG